MRATAALRSTGPPTRHPVGHFGSDINAPKSGLPHKCWICKNSSHWTDQCQKFASLNLENRIKAVKENHACFSCLKRAGRDHRSSNCSRKKSNGIQCPYYHHPSTIATVTSVINNQKALLPIVQVDIVGQGHLLQRANALMDSGKKVKRKERCDHNHKGGRPRRGAQHEELLGAHQITGRPQRARHTGNWNTLY